MCWASGGTLCGAQEVPVVYRPLVRRAKRGVRLGDLDEALCCMRVVWVEVGVVGFGELVELFLNLPRRSIGLHFQRRIVVWHAITAAACLAEWPPRSSGKEKLALHA